MEYHELQGSPEESKEGAGEFRATRRFKVAWADRAALMDTLIGTEYQPISGTFAICNRVSSAPFMEGQQQAVGPKDAAYEHAMITAEWNASSSGGSMGTGFISESLEPSAEYIRHDYTKLAWGTNNGRAVTPAEAPGHTRRSFDWVVTRYRLTAISASVLSYINTVNALWRVAATPLFFGWNFPPETLLFSEPYFEASGGNTVTARYRLSYKPNWDYTDPLNPVARGWNWFWNQQNQNFERIFVRGTNKQVRHYQPVSWLL